MIQTDFEHFGTVSRREFLMAQRACRSLAGVWRLAHRKRRQSGPPAFSPGVGTARFGEGDFSACVGIAIDTNDEVHTAEFRNRRVQKFTTEGRFLDSFPVQPYAGGLAVDRDGSVYVAHWNSNKIAVYSRSGKLLREWARRGPPTANSGCPGPWRFRT